MLEKFLNRAPVLMSWNVVDRSAPEEEGFASVEEAMLMYLWRINGMINILTTNTDAMLTKKEMYERDKVVAEFLDDVKRTYNVTRN